MASIRERTTKRGETVWSVLYRHGGKQTSTTFAIRTGKRSGTIGAVEFAQLVDTLGPDQALAHLAETEGEKGITVRDLAAQWFARREERRDLTRRALEDYRRDYDNWIDPFFGHRGAAHITEQNVQDWVDKHLAPNLAPKTVADRHALLHGIYKWAAQRKRGLVPNNPCTETELPKRSKKPPKGLTLPEWLALKDAAYRVDCDAADLILFMASTGWRIGEATALMPLGVDDSGPRMYVTMTHVNRKGEGVVVGAKSDAGHRRLSVSSECAQMIRRRLAGLGPTDYVFTNPHSPTGLWEPSTFRNRWWAKSVAAAGLGDAWKCSCGASGGSDTAATDHEGAGHDLETIPGRNPTPHWLRHTHVMLCHAAGMSLPEIQRRIGHEDIKTTINVYGRMIDDMSDDVADKLDLLLSGRGVPVVGEVVRPELD